MPGDRRPCLRAPDRPRADERHRCRNQAERRHPPSLPGSMRMPTIDLNSDLAEGYGAYRCGDDDAMLSIVTSANVACGFHAGDPEIMARTFGTAKARGAPGGPHPGLPHP